MLTPTGRRSTDRLLKMVSVSAFKRAKEDGVLAWMICINACISNAIVIGIDNSFGDREQLEGLAGQLSKEEVQLFYQVGLIGKRDLPLAPDPQIGF